MLQFCFEHQEMFNMSLDISENINFTNIEHVFSNSRNDPTILLVSFVGCILILSTNSYLTKFILNQSSKTFLDWMMVFDSFLCICNIITIAYIIDEEYFKIGKNLNLCYFLPYFTYFINLCNRLLTIGIVLYRYIFVIKCHLVRTPDQRKTLGSKIFGSIIIVSLLMTAWATYYRAKSQNFLCNFNSFFCWISIH